MKKIKTLFLVVTIMTTLLSSCKYILENITNTENQTTQITETTDITSTTPVFSTTEPVITEKETEPSPTTQKSREEASKMIAFTFDDGPNATITNRILDVLEKYNFTATFFVVGYNIGGSNSEAMKRAIDLGCEIGNHTMHHSMKFDKLSANGKKQEINDTEVLITSTLETSPVLFRPPGGVYANTKGNVDMPIILWSVDTNDWRKKNNAGNYKAAMDLANYIISEVEGKPGSIVLMHDIYQFTAETVELVIPILAEKGYIITSVSKMAEAFGAKLEPGKVYTHIKYVANLQPGQYEVTTNHDPLFLRDTPDNGNIIGEIPKGETITVTECKNGYAKTSYDGQTGWVSAHYLTAIK